MHEWGKSVSDPQLLTEHLFRTKYGEILAALLRQFGYEHFDSVEEAVQTAFQRALEKWLYTGVPENPAGWLFTVARNAYLEGARRKNLEASKRQELEQSARQEIAFGSDPEFTESFGVPMIWRSCCSCVAILSSTPKHRSVSP